MTSEIRTNSLTSRAGLSTVTLTDSGPMFSGITTFVDNSGFNLGTGSSIFTPASNTLTFGTNSNERARITSGGNVGIGTDNPATKTAIVGSDSGDVYLQIANSTTGSDANSGFLVGLKSDEGATLYQMENNYMRFGTNGAERLRITSAGRILIATTTEGHSNADDLTIATAAGSLGNTGITIRSSTTGDGNIFFSDATSGDGETKGVIKYAHNTDHMQFNIAGSERLRINSNGAFGLGGATYGSSGQVLTSAGSGSVPTWTTVSGTTINSNADNRVITGSGTANTLNAEQYLTWDGQIFKINAATNDNPLQVDTGSSNGAHMRFFRNGTQLHFFGCGTGISLGDSEDLSMRSYDNILFATGNTSTEKLRIHSNGDISIGDNHTSATQRVDILNGADEDNIVIIRGADATTEYAAVGVNGGNAIITGGSSGSNNVGIIFRTANSGTETQRLRLTNGGVLHVGDDSVSNTVPSGGLDLQGNGTNCVLEMGNPFPGYAGGMTPELRITTVDASHTVEFRTVWGGTNGLYKHMSFSGGATMFYDGIDTENEIVRITGSALMVGTTSSSSSTQAKGISLNNDGAMVSRRDGVMHYYKSISTGGYYANIFLSANTTVGSIFFNSGGTQFNTSSDYRRKENVVSLTDGISKLKQLKPYRFNFKDNPSETVDGFLAHEAQEIVPHTVTGTKDQVSTSKDVDAGIATTVGEPIYQQMDLSKLVPLLTASLQELNTKVETLEQENIALRARVTNLEGN